MNFIYIMSFKELNDIIKLPEDLNNLIYAYYDNTCQFCKTELEYCETCGYYLCYCINISACYICKKISYESTQDTTYNMDFKHKIFMCDNCWDNYD